MNSERNNHNNNHLLLNLEDLVDKYHQTNSNSLSSHTPQDPDDNVSSSNETHHSNSFLSEVMNDIENNNSARFKSQNSDIPTFTQTTNNAIENRSNSSLHLYEMEAFPIPITKKLPTKVQFKLHQSSGKKLIHPKTEHFAELNYHKNLSSNKQLETPKFNQNLSAATDDGNQNTKFTLSKTTENFEYRYPSNATNPVHNRKSDDVGEDDGDDDTDDDKRSTIKNNTAGVDNKYYGANCKKTVMKKKKNNSIVENLRNSLVDKIKGTRTSNLEENQGEEIKKTKENITTKTPKLLPPDERIDLYFFDHGNAEYFRTTDCQPNVFAETIAHQTTFYANRFWAEIFGSLQIGITFIITFFLQTYRFLLFSLIRSILIGFLQITSDYFIKPILTVSFNGFIQPFLILIYNILASIRDMLEPICNIIEMFIKPIVLLIRNVRIIHVKNHNNYGPQYTNPKQLQTQQFNNDGNDVV